MTNPKPRKFAMTLSQFFRNVYLKRRHLEPGTQITYWCSVNRFQDWFGQPISLAKINARLIRNFLAEYGEHNSATSVNRHRRTLLTLLNFAHRWGYADLPPRNDEIAVLPVPKRNPEAWTLKEFGRIIDACSVARRIKHRGVLWDYRHWRALWLVIYDTGERLDALLQTLRCDLTATGRLLIRGEHRKGKRRDIVRRLHEQTMAVISELPSCSRLFPWPLSKRAIFREVEPILRAAGLPVNHRSKFHCGRRTSATHVAAILGAEKASRHLDHSTVQLTISSYIDRRQIPDEDVTGILPRPLISPDTPADENDNPNPNNFRIVG